MNGLLDLIRQCVAPVASVICVMVVAAYLLMRTRVLDMILNRSLSLRGQLMLVVPFTLFSLYGGFGAVPLAGSYVALDLAGQIVGGLLAGPVVGIGTGTLLAMVRYSFGDELALPAALACMMAGLFAGLYHEWNREWNNAQRITAQQAGWFAAAAGIFGLVLSLLLPDFVKAWNIVAPVALPTVAGNALAVGVLIYVLNARLDEQNTLVIKKKMEKELSLAQDIQKHLIPRTFPPVPVAKEFAIYGEWAAGKDVGGSFYDFFFIDEQHFCFFAGDASGQGVPAGMIMAATRRLLKNMAVPGLDPDELLYKVNNEICPGNEAVVAVTLFLGVLDIRSGEVICSNAGNIPPLIYSADGRVRHLREAVGIPLGGMEDMPYSNDVFTLNPGEVLVIATNSVTETRNPKNEKFSKEQLAERVRTGKTVIPQAVVKNILQELENFTAGAERPGDVTLLALSYTADMPGGHD